MVDPTQTQVVNTLPTDFDAYGNSKLQTVKTYNGTVTEDHFSNIRKVENTYGDPIAQKKGNATLSTSTRYSDIDL